VSYRALDANEIIATLRRLETRISERFPGRGLQTICQELVSISEQVQQKSAEIARANIGLRVLLIILVAAAAAGMLVIAFTVQLQVGTPEIFGVFQGVEAAANIVVLLGALLFFLVTLESRVKRRKALHDLHAFRSIAHVIDMHQLTKDPSVVITEGPATQSSPRRTMTRFQLSRYLDYCSEMLSLTSKLAALYAQNLPDPVIIEAVKDIEQLTTNLSNKIWQKITILDAARDLPRPPRSAAPSPSAPPAPAAPAAPRVPPH
jgi:hypothetical protein